ncbi:MAG: glycosyltransferase family 87 protein [Eubacteriales bacterium]|nr:glycosyltransferase family 87 protein [Eubacteriales bacterium]
MRTKRRIFYGIFLFSLVFSAVYLAVRRGAGIEGFLFNGGKSIFGDFINNLHYPTHEGGPYFDSRWASFPPFAYTLYYLVNVCYTRANTSYEILAYTMVTALTFVLILYAVQRLFRRHGAKVSSTSEPLLLTACLLFSGVMIFAVERGNSVVNVLAMLLLAFDLRESEKAWQREAALLLIAAAAGFKIYPCLFGLLYVFEKRYREALRLLAYGVLIFFVPFLWFGGVEGFLRFIQNQREVQSSIRSDYFTSIPSISSYLAAEFGWDAGAVLTAGKAVAAAYGVLLAVGICLQKKLWLRVTLMVSLFTLVPGWSAEYMAIYMMLPFVLFYCDEGETRWETLYAVLFGCVFILLPFSSPLKTHTTLSWNMLVSFGALYALSAVSLADTFSARPRVKQLKENAV